MNFHEAIGHGIIGGATAAAVGFFTLIVRWIYLGAKQDFQSWKQKRQEKRSRRGIKRARVEPPIQRK